MDRTDITHRASLMLQGGASQRQVADALGLSRHAVRKIANAKNTTTALAVPDNVRVPAGASLSGLAGRASKDHPNSMNRWSGALAQVAPTSDFLGARGAMSMKLFDVGVLERTPLPKVIDQVVDGSPELSRALWDFLRMGVSGYECTVFRPGPGKAPFKRGQELLDNFRESLKWKHGDESVIYRRLFANGYTRGAMIMELVMDERGRMPVDLVAPDPALFCFRMIDDEWVLGQYQNGEWVAMDRPTFRHVQLDQRGNRPEGHPPIAGALFPALFLLGMFQDLRRVIANQGYPRLDIKVNTEQLAALLASEIFESLEDFDAAAAKLTARIAEQINNVGPGEAYIHLDLVEMGAPIGALSAELQSIGTVIESLERMAVRGMKTMPLNMSITDAAGESNANRQWEMYTEAVKSIQRPAEILIETEYELALQAMGVIAQVEFRFATIRAAEAFRDAQTERIIIDNAALLQDRGWLTPNEAAQKAVGFVSKAVKETYGDDADGSAATGGGDTDTSTDPPDEGTPNSDEDRQVRLIPPVPQDVPVTALDDQHAADRFDEVIPDFAGMLDARVES